MKDGHNHGFIQDRLRHLEEETLSFEEVDREIERARAFRSSEPALIHPFTHSVVKLRDNGMIDVMVDGDNGVRIDPATQTINLLTEMVKVQADGVRTWLTGKGHLFAAGGWTVETEGAVTVKAGRLNVDVPVSAITIQGRSLTDVIWQYSDHTDT